MKWIKGELMFVEGRIIQMLEAVGTGGAGFRFIYAAFLQEAAEKLNNDELFSVSEEMTEIGDSWRKFSILAGRICKNRGKEKIYFKNLSEILV